MNASTLRTARSPARRILTAGLTLLGSLVLLLASRTLAVNQNVADTEPPTRPLSLTLTAKGATSITLHWSASSDNVAVDHYEILRNGDYTGPTSTSNSFTYTDLTPGSSYTFRVRAWDAAGNVSDGSNALLATPED